MKTYDSMTSAYVGLLKDVYTTPEHEAAPRGMNVRERLGHSFRIVDIKDRIPYIPHRDFSISYMIAELLWYLSGGNETAWISYYAPFWRNISDDGMTANSAYGSRIFKLHPYQTFEKMPGDFTQWKYLKDELTSDSDSRRAVIHIRMPQDSYLATKDVPCTLALQFFIRDGALHQVASMRSSDLVLGIAYDIPAFTMFQELLALELGVPAGTYTHISNSLHIYERNFEMVEKILRDPWLKEFPGRAQAMPSLPSLPPIELMMNFEAKFRNAVDEIELNVALESFDAECVLDGLHQYWRDWMLVLAWHRAGKLGLEHLQQKLMSMVQFPGYKVFKK